MQSSMRKVMTGAVIFATTSIVAVIGYWLAGWSLLEAIYMVIITIYGVGYGEVRPIEEPGLKVFTIGVIIAGCTSAIYVLGGLVQMIAEGEFYRVLGARRMTKGIEGLKDHVIICGYGRVGQILARDLLRANCPFVVIDRDQDRLREAEAAGMFVIVGDGSEEATLMTAGVQRARLLTTVLPDDAMNVFITLTARELAPGIEIIARGETPSTEKKLLRSGANRVVLPAAIGATRIAGLITRPSAEELLNSALGESQLQDDLHQLGLTLSEFQVTSGSQLCGRPLGEVGTEGKEQFVIVAVRKAGGDVVRQPPAALIVEANDTMIVLGNESALPQLVRRATTVQPQVTYRGATVPAGMR